jgi:hypothetical protein
MNPKSTADGVSVLVCVVVWLTFSTASFAFGPYGELVRLSGAPLLETRFEGYAAEALSGQLNLIGGRGRALYEQFQVLDAANAILMAIALSLLIRFAVSRLAGERSALKALLYLPVAACILELAENAALIDALRRFPAAGSFADTVGSVTQLKLVVGFGSLLLALLSLVALGVAPLVRRTRRS